MVVDREAGIKKMMSYRWVIFWLLAVSYFFVYFHRLSMGVVKDDLVREFGISAVTYANLGNMYFYAYMIMQIPSGMLADTWGPRKTVAIGSFVAGCGAILFGFAPVVEVAFVGRLLVGLGIAVIYVCCMRINAVWFRSDEFGRVVGLNGFIGNLGAMFAQMPLAVLVGLLTWRYTYYAIGATSIVLAFLVYSFVRNKPEDMGYPSMAEIEGTTQKSRPESSVIVGLLNVFKNFRTWVVFLIFTLYAGSYITFAGVWSVPFFKNVYHLNNMEASKLNTFLVAGVCIGYLITGFVSDKIKSRKIPLVTLGGLLNIFWWLLLYYNDGHLPVGVLPVVIFAMGVSIASFTMCFSLAKEVNEPNYVATAISVVNTGPYLVGIVISPLTGSVLDHYQNILSGIELYRKALIYFPACTVIAFVISLFVKETKCRNIYWDNRERGVVD